MNKAIAKDGNEIKTGYQVRWTGDSGKGLFWQVRTVECVYGDDVDLEGHITCKASDIVQVLTKEQFASECEDFADFYSAIAD